MPEEQEPTKKVVKRVVKKKAVRKPPEQTMRFGRPAANRGTKPVTNAPRTVNRRPAAKSAQSRTQKPGLQRLQTNGAQKNRHWGKKTAGAVSGGSARVGQMTKSLGAGGWRKISTSSRRATSWRPPRLPQISAAAITGLLVSCLSIGLVGFFAQLFSSFRGTSSGGGRWGSLAIVVVAVLSFAAGQLILRALHVRQPQLTSLLAVCLTIMAILAFFLGVIDSVWAWLIMPPLGAAAYAISHKLIWLADAAADERSNR